MTTKQVISLINEKIVSNEIGNITAEVLNNVLKEIVKLNDLASIDVTRVVTGQYATITVNVPLKTYIYIYTKHTYNSFLKLTQGTTTGDSVRAGWDKSITHSGGGAKTPDKGIYVAPDYGNNATIIGFATSDNNYTSWNDIPNYEKVEFAV